MRIVKLISQRRFVEHRGYYVIHGSALKRLLMKLYCPLVVVTIPYNLDATAPIATTSLDLLTTLK